MTPESLQTMMSWYHNDEGQLLLLMGSLLGTGIAMTALTITTSLTTQTRFALGSFCGIGFLTSLSYAVHLSSRMQEIRHFLSLKKVVSDLPVAYVNRIVGTEWNSIPVLMYIYSAMIVVMLIVLYSVKRLERVRMPRLPTGDIAQ